jgi:hypothetical protein
MKDLSDAEAWVGCRPCTMLQRQNGRQMQCTNAPMQDEVNAVQTDQLRSRSHHGSDNSCARLNGTECTVDISYHPAVQN